jgi:hypothetical protein
LAGNRVEEVQRRHLPGSVRLIRAMPLAPRVVAAY